jgi:hypothetical protein
LIISISRENKRNVFKVKQVINYIKFIKFKRRLKMIQNKKGLSDIVVTLIIIVLALVAIGGVWFVVRNVLNTGGQGVDLGAKCLNANLEIQKVNCATPAACTATLGKTGSEVITGVKFVFKDAAGTSGTGMPLTQSGDVPNLAGKSYTALDSGLTAPKTLEVTPYFTDASGKEQLCSSTVKYSW